MKIDIETLKKDILLALLANGDTEFNKDHCECDPSVGVHCRYCAIHYALRDSLCFIEEHEKEISRLNDEVEFGRALVSLGSRLRKQYEEQFHDAIDEIDRLDKKIKEYDNAESKEIENAFTKNVGETYETIHSNLGSVGEKRAVNGNG